MNIVFVSDQYWPSVSGVPVSIDSFKENLIAKGHNIFLLVPDYPEAAKWDEDNEVVNVFRFKSRSIFFNKKNRLVKKNEKKKIYKRLDLIRPDIIHVHTEFSLAEIVMKYAKANNIPLVLTAHTNWEELINEYVKFLPKKIGRMYCRSMLRRVFNKVDRVVVPTTLMESRLNEYLIQSPIQVIPTGISAGHLSQVNVESEEGHCDDAFSVVSRKVQGHKTLLYVGRLGREKNIKFIIDAFYKLVKEDFNLRLVIVGDGPEKDELESYCMGLGLKESVIFTGFVQRNTLTKFYKMAHVFVFASKVESQGLVILESMTCGTPVVAIGEMGTRALMASGRGGYMVEDNLDLFIEKVKLLLSDPELYAIKSAEALVEAQKWGSEVMSKKMMELYYELLEEKGAA